MGRAQTTVGQRPRRREPGWAGGGAQNVPRRSAGRPAGIWAAAEETGRLARPGAVQGGELGLAWALTGCSVSGRRNPHHQARSGGEAGSGVGGALESSLGAGLSGGRSLCCVGLASRADEMGAIPQPAASGRLCPHPGHSPSGQRAGQVFCTEEGLLQSWVQVAPNPGGPRRAAPVLVVCGGPMWRRLPGQ